MKIAPSFAKQNSRIEQLIIQIKKYYSCLEDKEWATIYDMLSYCYSDMESKYPNGGFSKSELIDSWENDWWGWARWEFAYLGLKTLNIKENEAYVEMEGVFEWEGREIYERGPPSLRTWWDEWVYEDGNWILYGFFNESKDSL